MEQVAKRPNRRRLRLTVVFALALAGLGVGGYYFWTFVVQSNFAVVIPGKVYRSGQPSPDQLTDWVGKYGIKTIINLRGNTLDICKAEQEQAGKMNVRMVPIPLGKTRLVSKARLALLIDTLEKSPKPILLHCQSGIDRSGVASMLAVMALGQTDYATAHKQLGAPWVRFGKNKRHISDTIALYEQYCRENKLDPNNWPQFEHWAKDIYSPDPNTVEDHAQAE